MHTFPHALFKLPREKSYLRKKLIGYLDHNIDDISLYFPWLSSEIIHFAGAQKYLDFLDVHGSTRVAASLLFDFFPELLGRKGIIMQNNNYDENFDIQSVSGFFECSRRAVISRLIKAGANTHEITSKCCVSVRTIQRLKKTLMKSDKDKKLSSSSKK